VWIREQNGSTIISCKVHPNAKRDAIGEVKNDQLHIYLTSTPVDGKANMSLVKYISKQVRTAKSNVCIVRGEKSRNKAILVKGKRPEEIVASLGLNPTL